MKTCFVVFEPANHMFKVVEAAAARGLHVVAFHSNPLRAEGAYKAGLAAVAESHQVQSWQDEEAVRRFVLERTAGYAIAGTYTSYEALLPLERRLREQLGLPVNSRAVLERLLDKRAVRATLLELGLSRLQVFHPRELVHGPWPLPGKSMYLKPATGSGSLFVSRCSSPEDIAIGLAQWDEGRISFSPIQRQHLMRSGELFLEQDADGELMSLEGFTWEGKYHALGLTSRTVLARDESIEMGATFPYEHPLRAAIEEKMAAIHAALGITHGATHAELIVSADQQVELVELNPRFAGSDVLLLIDLAYGTAIGELLADLACGIRPQSHSVGQPHRYASVQQLLAASRTETIDEVGIDQVLVTESRMVKPAGTAITSTDYQHDQVAAFIVTDTSYPAVLEKARAVRAGATINGKLLGMDPNNVVILR